MSVQSRTHPLSTEVVLAAALELADREGIDGFSMRRLASELGVTPMALYKHVDDKQALVDLMADTALGELSDIDPDGTAADELLAFFLALHRLLVAHPALAEVTMRRPVEGPTAARIADRVLELLCRSGLSDARAARGFVTLFNYTCGVSLYRLSRDRPGVHRFDRIDPAETPTAYRMRDLLAGGAEEQQVRDALSAIIAGL